jgi:hypothetical protein
MSTAQFLDGDIVLEHRTSFIDVGGDTVTFACVPDESVNVIVALNVTGKSKRE